jgi:hypothetical protein
MLSEQEQLDIALALSLEEPATPPRPPPSRLAPRVSPEALRPAVRRPCSNLQQSVLEPWALDLPDKMDGKTLRSRSDTNLRNVNGTKMVRAGSNAKGKRELCHRLPNEVLTECYNTTEDLRIKQDIVKFNMSTDNIRRSGHNGDHTEMEKGLKSGDYYAKDFNRKQQQIERALENLHQYDDYSDKGVTHILRTLKEFGPGYNRIVAELDKRKYSSNKDAKDLIQAARDEQDSSDTKQIQQKSQADSTENQVRRTRKDGKPDMRFSANKTLDEDAKLARRLHDEERVEAMPRGTRKDGKLDMRFSANKTLIEDAKLARRLQDEDRVEAMPRGVRKDGKPDMRFGGNRSSNPKPQIRPSGGGARLRNDGQPDMRFAANRVDSAPARHMGPLRGDGQPDMRYRANRQAAVSPMRSSPSQARPPQRMAMAPPFMMGGMGMGGGGGMGMGGGMSGGGTSGGGRCQNGSLDMRFACNRGQSKYG